MKKLSQLLESINEIDSLLELDFKDKKAFQKYQSVHKMKPTTKVNIAGKDTTVGDETGDDSETPQAPKKTTGADIEKQADKSGKEQDDIEKDIAGDLMGDEPKGDTTADTLTKGLKDGGLNPYKDGPLINQALDDIGGDHSDLKKRIDTYGDNVPSSKGKSEAQYQKEIDKYKEEGEKLSNDIVDAISDEPKSDKAGTKAAIDSALKRFNDEVDLDSFEDNPAGFDSLQDIANDLEQTPIGQDPEFGDLYDDLMDNQDTESAENFKKYLDDQSTVDKPTKDSKGRTIPKAPKYDTPKKTGSKKPSSLDSYYAKEDAKKKWLSSNPGKTSYDWSRLPYGTMSDLISKEMRARGFKENINLKELSKITTRYTNRIDERSTLTLRGKNGKMVDVPRKFASIISGIDRGMSKFNPRGVMFGHRKYHKLKPNDEYSGSIILKNPLSKKDIDVVMKHLKSAGSSLGFKFEKITFNPDRNEPFVEFRVNNASIK